MGAWKGVEEPEGSQAIVMILDMFEHTLINKRYVSDPAVDASRLSGSSALR